MRSSSMIFFFFLASVHFEKLSFITPTPNAPSNPLASDLCSVLVLAPCTQPISLHDKCRYVHFCVMHESLVRQCSKRVAFHQRLRKREAIGSWQFSNMQTLCIFLLFLFIYFSSWGFAKYVLLLWVPIYVSDWKSFFFLGVGFIFLV